MNNLPKQYIDEITMESKIRSINGINNMNIPDEIRTIQDLWIHRHSLPSKINIDDKFDAITNILNSNISLNDVEDKEIETVEDFKLSLFSIIANGVNMNKNGEELSCEEMWGKNIHNVVANNVILICRKGYFDLPNVRIVSKPDINVNNVLLFEDTEDISLYVFTTAEKDEIKKAPAHGLSDDTYISKISSTYLDRVCACLNIDCIENNLDLCKITKNGLLMIKSRDLDLIGIIPPRHTLNEKKSWYESKGPDSYELLSENIDY